MKIKITALSNNVYQFADKTISDNSTGTWRGRIVNAPDISRSFSDLGSVASTLYIQLINHDLQIPLTEDLWNASIDVETDNGYKWSGKVSAYETNADGKMYITATETTAPEYSRYIPDEFARLVSIDEDVHMSALNVTIPTVIGGNANNPIPVKGILKSKSDAIYYLCVGEIHDIVNVRVGDTTMTKAQAEAKGYMCYTGSASQTNEPGIAYIQITDTSKRLNDDGSYVEIGAEVIGLKLGTHTVEECRNGARFLYWLLKTAASGVCGWGLGININDIDASSFETAITYVDTIGLKLDGVMYENRSAQNWIDEICRVIRGTYEIGSDGKRRLSIDVASTSAYTYTKDNIELIRFGAGSFTGRVYNKGTLDYCYNPITGLFMQSAQYQNAESIARIDEQLFEGESYFIRDAETAQKIVEYTCKKSLVEANKILFNTRFLPENCRIGTVITVNYPEKGMNNSLFKITSLQIGDHINRIEAVKYDENIYTSGSVSPTVAWQNDEPIVSPVSVERVNNLTLNSSFDILPDGTGIASITGTFSMPGGSYMTAVVEYSETSSPSVWYAVGLLKADRFKISPVKIDTLYTVRVRLVNNTGHSDFVTASINTIGDSVPPSEPTTFVAKATDKTVTIQCGLLNPPYDMGGFQIYRKRSADSDSSYAPVGCVAAESGYASFVDYVDEYTSYTYKAKSYDRSGNLSTNFSNTSSVTVTGITANDIAATALAMPTGSILRLSAKNCHGAEDSTTPPTYENHISDVNGVKDVSGRDNHGQAHGNTTVIDGGEGFAFDGSQTAYIDFSNSNLLNRINGSEKFTIVVKGKCSDLTKPRMTGLIASNANLMGFFLFSSSSGDIVFYDRLTSSSNAKTLSASVDCSKEHSYVASVDYQSGVAILYVDGEEKARNSEWFTGVKADVSSVILGRSNTSNTFKGEISDFRIYPRVLSASEVKTVFMFPDDVVFAQMTADLIGANIIKGFNLFSENIITSTAQITQAVVNNLNVSGNATFNNALNGKMSVNDFCLTENNVTVINGGMIKTNSITANQIAADAVTADKISVVGTSARALFRLSIKGSNDYSAGNLVADLSGQDNSFKFYGTWQSLAIRGLDGVVVFDGRNTSTKSLRNTKAITIPASGFTVYFELYYSTVPSSGSYYYFFEAYNGSDNKNRLFIRLTSAKKIQIYSYDSSPTSTVIELDTALATGNYYSLAVKVTSTTSITAYLGLMGQGIVETKTATVGTRTSFTAPVGGIRISTNYGNNAPINAIVARPALYNDISLEKIKLLNKGGVEEETGTITADRLAVDAIKSRNVDGGSDGNYTSQGSRMDLSTGWLSFHKCCIGSDGKIKATDVDLTGKINATSGNIGNFLLQDGMLLSSGTDTSSSFIGLEYSTSSYEYVSWFNCGNIKLEYWTISNNTKYITNRTELMSNMIRMRSFSNGQQTSQTAFGSSNVSINVGGSNTGEALNVTGKVTVNGTVVHGSDENIKSEIKDVSVLDKLKKIRVKSWKYDESKIKQKEYQLNLEKYKNGEIDEQPVFEIINIKSANEPLHIGAMAKEFNESFGTNNNSEDYISYTDEIGVALRAIQELAAEVDELKAKLKIQQDEKSDVEQETSYTEKSDNSKDADNLEFADVWKMLENQQEEQK